MPKRKRVFHHCTYCNQLVNCDPNNPSRSMQLHQNKPRCKKLLPSLKLQKTTDHSTAIKENFSEVIVEPNGPMNMDIHILPKDVQVLPFPEFLEEFVYNDPVLANYHNILPTAMDIPSERERSKMFGTSLISQNYVDEVLVYKDQKVRQPSFEPYKFQKRLERDYFDELQRKRHARSQRRSKSELEEQVGLKPVDSIVLDLLYIHSMRKRFTISEVDNFLALMDDTTTISYQATVNKTQWRTTKKNYDKFIDVFSPLKRPEFTLPPEMYGENDPEGNPILPYYGVAVHILEEIGFELLRVKNVKDFVFEHEPMEDCNGLHLTGPFQTANKFRELDHYVKNYHGEDTVALCLALYSDPTKLNPTMSRNVHPVYLTILNIRQSKPIFVGFIPYEVHDIATLEDYLSKNKLINVNKLKDEILACLKPSDMMRFFEFLFDPLFDLSENGIVWQVGRGSNAETRRFVPFIVDQLGDELIQSERTGCSYQCKNFSCGRCLRKNCFSFYNPPIDNDFSMGSYVTFKHRNQVYQSFIIPYSIKRLHVSKDFEEPRKRIMFSDLTNLFVLEEHDNRWYDIKTFDQTKVYIDTKIKKGVRSTIIYNVQYIERNRGVLINENTMLAIEDVEINDLITLRRPLYGLCNFGLGGTWKDALVVRVFGDLLDILYDDGDIEKQIPKTRFIYFDAPRSDYQMNMISEGKLSILLRRIEHFRTTGDLVITLTLTLTLPNPNPNPNPKPYPNPNPKPNPNPAYSLL